MTLPFIDGVEIFLNADVTLTYANLAGDVAGLMPSWQLKRTVNQIAPSLDKTDASGIVVAGTFSVNQTVAVTINAADTEHLTPGVYVCELKRMQPGVEMVLSFGAIVLRASVHRGY